MTDTEHRVSKLEDKYHSIDTRQESFETFTKAQLERLEQKQDSFETFVRSYIEGNEKRLERMDAKFDKMEAKIDNMNRELSGKIDGLIKFVHSLTVTAMIGMLGIAGSVVYFVYSVTPKP